MRRTKLKPSTVDPEVLVARVVLGWIVEPGNIHLHALVKAEGPVEAVRAICAGKAHEELCGPAAARLGGFTPERMAESLISRSERLGLRIVVPEDAQWPSTLDDLSLISRPGDGRIERDTFPPQALWLRGEPELSEVAEHSVAMVGARASTAYGEHVAAELAYGLASRGWTVLSGGAYGIDAVAHRGALTAAGRTVAVLASGLDKLYPPSNTGLFDQIAQEGLLISEWPPGADPHGHRFLIRNRVIAALSRGTILVEASARSGARFTLRRARQLGRRAMAVPGPVTSDMSAGCHDELRREAAEQARLVTTVEQVLEEVGAIGQLSVPARAEAGPRDGLDPVEQQLVDAAPIRGAALPEQIARDAGVSLRDALAKLPSLAVRGYLEGGNMAGYSAVQTRSRRS